ncbi:MAG: molybdopterin-guanine dinucleotide biosynthesis protein MobB [Nitrososphaerota archaeon]|nr:molybdopterin-guanine dinucleotide biosynthesis protein MobB [Candidatus Bathyarchaeota archaeon]MDW8049101.1 molybdopterin-guanine dinucleotide biosynthesis protein MobB [Nitrososphaerota archaeon]
MNLGRIPVVAVIGRKNSGKTLVIEALTSSFVSRGIKVACAKHVNEKGFSMDAEGKDTWRYTVAGAQLAAAASDVEVAVRIRKPLDSSVIEALRRYSAEEGASVLLLEGFSSFVIGDVKIGKIICVKGKEDYIEFKEKAKGEIIAFCSLYDVDVNVMNLKKDLAAILQKTHWFVEKMTKVYQCLDILPRLDCGKCGRTSCEDLAVDIIEGRATAEECIHLRLRPALKVKIKVNGEDVPLQPFVSEFVRRTVLGMLSALKGITVRGDEDVIIEILKRQPRG